MDYFVRCSLSRLFIMMVFVYVFCIWSKSLAVVHVHTRMK